MRHTQIFSFFTIATAVLLLLSCESRNSDSETSVSHNEELAMDFIEAFNARDRAALEELLTDPTLFPYTTLSDHRKSVV